MNRYETARRQARIVWMLIVMLTLPPGFMPAAMATNRRINTLTRDSALETFRNPMFNAGDSNRFLATNTPLALLGQGGDDFSEPDKRGYGSVAQPARHWVSYKGRLEWADNDVSLPGVGMPLIFQRIYRGSVSSYDGPLGKEWEFNWNRRIQYDASGSPTKAWFYDQGRRESYDLSAGSYTAPSGRYDVLTRTATPEYWRTDNVGLKEIYEQEASDATWFRIKSLTDRNSNAINFAYDSTSRLTKVTDTLGQDTLLSYDGNDRVTKVADPTSREWVYAYDSNGRLTTVRTPTVDEAGSDDDYTSGKTTTYKYDSGGLLTEVLRPGDGGTGTWKWEYDAGSGKISKQTRGGNDYLITYHDSNPYSVSFASPEGITTSYFYDNSDDRKVVTRRAIIYAPHTSWDTSYAYDANTNVTLAEFPAGNQLAYTFDGNGNVVSVQFKKDSGDGNPIKWTYTWANYGRLSTLTDPNGNVWDFDYDSNGNLTHKAAPAVTVPSGIASADNNGNGIYDGTIAESWEYTARGLVTKYTDPVGTVMRTSYTTVSGNSAYPDKVTRDQGTSKLNLITDYDYNSAGNVTGVTDQNGNSTSYTVNALNQTIMAVEPLSVTKKYHFDPNNRLTRTEASNDTQVGNSWFVLDRQFDQADNLTNSIGDLDSSGSRLTTSFGYDGDDRMTSVTDPVGIETRYKYDQRGLKLTVTHMAVSSGDYRITVNVLDDNGNAVTVTDPRGNHTIRAYDGYDRMTKQVEPQGNYTKWEFDYSSNVTKVQRYNAGNAKLAETTYLVDEANRRYETDAWAKRADLSTSLGDGLQSTIMWRDETGRTLESSGDICGCSAWEHVYDALGRKITSKDPMGNADNTRNLIITAYDNNDNVTKRILKDRSQNTGIEADRDIETQFVFDARNRLVTRREKQGFDADTVFYYGLRDQLTKALDAEGDESRIEHNEQLWRANDILENGASDVKTEYTYDSNGRVVTYVAKNSITGDQATLYAYDTFGEVVTTTWPPNSVTAEKTVQVYDKNRNRISTTDPNGTVSVCAYDKNNRLTSRSNTLASNIVGATALTFGYDGMNRMTSASTSEGGAYTSSLAWTFNTLSKPETEKQVLNGYNSNNGRTVSYAWDDKGQKTNVTYPTSGSVISYMRDALDRADTISRDSTEIVDYAFSGQRILQKAYPGSEALYTYEAYGRLTEVHHRDTSSGHTLGKFTYGWDASSQVTNLDKVFYDDVQNTRITTDGSDLGDQYQYDGAKRLVSVLRGVPSNKMTVAMGTNISNNDFTNKVLYTYDQTGNRLTRDVDGTSRAYAYDQSNEMTTEAGNTLTHNKNGAYVGNSNVYKYTFTNQIGKFETTPVVYHYDALGRLIEREYPSVSSERFYYDGPTIIEQNHWASSAETAKQLMVYGERTNELLEYVDIDSSPDRYYYSHADLLGSVMLLADETGVLQESYRYREFGETVIVDSSFAKLSTAESPAGNDTQYAGRRQDLGAVSTYGSNWYRLPGGVLRVDSGHLIQRSPLARNNRYIPTASSQVSGGSSQVSAGKGSVGPQSEKPEEPKPGIDDEPSCSVGIDTDDDGSNDVTCDTCSCGSLCAGLLLQVQVAVDSGSLDPSHVTNTDIKCNNDPEGDCGSSVVRTKNTITLNLAFSASTQCAGGLGFTLMHEIGHFCFFDAGWPDFSPDVAPQIEMGCDDFACTATGNPQPCGGQHSDLDAECD